VCARIRSRQVAIAAANCSSGSSAIAVTCWGELISTSWAPSAGREEKRSGSPALFVASSGSPALAKEPASAAGATEPWTELSPVSGDGWPRAG
jgi:hypothetical protein